MKIVHFGLNFINFTKLFIVLGPPNFLIHHNYGHSYGNKPGSGVHISASSLNNPQNTMHLLTTSSMVNNDINQPLMDMSKGEFRSLDASVNKVHLSKKSLQRKAFKEIDESLPDTANKISSSTEMSTVRRAKKEADSQSTTSSNPEGTSLTATTDLPTTTEVNSETDTIMIEPEDSASQGTSLSSVLQPPPSSQTPLSFHPTTPINNYGPPSINNVDLIYFTTVFPTESFRRLYNTHIFRPSHRDTYLDNIQNERFIPLYFKNDNSNHFEVGSAFDDRNNFLYEYEPLLNDQEVLQK